MQHGYISFYMFKAPAHYSNLCNFFAREVGGDFLSHFAFKMVVERGPPSAPSVTMDKIEPLKIEIAR